MHDLVSALEATLLPFAHFGWSHAPAGDYGTYSERGASSVWANGSMQEQTNIVVVDYYTRDDTGAPQAIIQDALQSVDCSWYLDLVDFDEGGMIHYVWILELPKETPLVPPDTEGTGNG